MMYLLAAVVLQAALVALMYRELIAQDPNGVLRLTPADVAGPRYPYISPTE